MIPPQAPIEAPPVLPPPAEDEAYWDYADVGLFIFLSVLGLFAAWFMLRFTPGLHSLREAYRLLIGQMIWYFFVFGSLALILKVRYDGAFWRSMGWKPSNPGQAFTSLASGPVIAIGLGLIGALLRTPQINLPFESMLNTAPLVVLFGLLVVVVGPLCEELAFRGFVLPLLIRSFGAVSGIVVTGMLFGMLHGFEYPDWRPVVLVAGAGMLFGWRRYETGSTVQSTLMHAGFNLTQFVALLAAKEAHLR